MRVRAKLISIGNLRGICLPRALIEKTGLGDKVILHAIGKLVIIEGRHDPRAGWDEATRDAIAEHGNELTEEDIDWLNAPLGPVPSGDR